MVQGDKGREVMSWICVSSKKAHWRGLAGGESGIARMLTTLRCSHSRPSARHVFDMASKPLRVLTDPARVLSRSCPKKSPLAWACWRRERLPSYGSIQQHLN
jgi:hypothetical protein